MNLHKITAPTYLQDKWKPKTFTPQTDKWVFLTCKLIAGRQKISAQTLELFLSREHDKHLLFSFAANQMVPGIQSLQ
jgi:hypothetical protein